MRKCTEKNTGKEYAVKIIDISGEKSDTYQAEQTKRDTIREINILRLCTGHPQISKCIKYLIYDFTPFKKKLFSRTSLITRFDMVERFTFRDMKHIT